MISEDLFTTLPSCDKCKNQGKYAIRCNTEELQDEHGVAAGEIVNIKCSRCRLHRRRREMFLSNAAFENPIRYFEVSDYSLPDKSQTIPHKKSSEAMGIVAKIVDDVEKNLIKPGGFLYITGGTNTGKTVASHIIARECYLQGFTAQLLSITDLSVYLSHRIEGDVVKNVDGKTVFDLSDYIDTDVLIVDSFEMINHYFTRANIRRGLILKMFRDRLKAEKPTIVLSKEPISELFSDVNRETLGFPYDFPAIITKNYRTMSLYGNFKKETSSK